MKAKKASKDQKITAKDLILFAFVGDGSCHQVVLSENEREYLFQLLSEISSMPLKLVKESIPIERVKP